MPASFPDIVTVALSTAVVVWGRVRFAEVPGIHRGACGRIDAALAWQGISTTAAPLKAGLGLDRHRRDARTIASHNPRIFRDRFVGDFAVNGAGPPRQYRVGSA